MVDFQAVAADVGQQIRIGFGAMLVESVREATTVQSRQLDAIGRIFDLNRYAGRRQRINADIGAAAQRSAIQAYRLRRHRRGTPPSRIAARNPRNNRFAGGALARALSSPSFYEATASGVRIINRDQLNAEAKHWRRLNFGAGAAGQGSPAPRQFEVRWSGLVVAAFGLQPDVRPAFRIPRGFWIAGGQRASGRVEGAEFFPTGELPRGLGRIGGPAKARMTAGIAAAQFLDAPVRRMAIEFPRAYEQFYRDLYAELGRQGLTQKIGVTAPRPVLQRIRVASRAG